VANLEFQLEQWSSDVGRVSAERDALANARNTLQTQLEACHTEMTLTSERAKDRSADEDIRAAFELERLIAAFGAPLYYIITPPVEPLPPIANSLSH
jgi:outer membrane murein-binding lipoprotein Lpp